jgi:hypothetical protein
MSTNDRYILAPEDRELLLALKEEEKRETSAADFCRNFLPFHSSKWSKICNVLTGEKSYFDEVSRTSGAALMDELRGVLAQIPHVRALEERRAAEGVLELSAFKAVKQAVQEAGSKRNPERLVKYLAPTGGGKSFLCTYLAQQLNARVVEARDAWRRSYYNVMTDMSRALGVRLGGESRPAVIEGILVERLEKQRTCLVIDEAEFFGAQAINGLKFLLNRTRLVIVLAAISEAHDRWNRYFAMEASQLDRRTHAVIRLQDITVEDCSKFFPKAQFEQTDEALKLIAAEATRFGAYSLVSRVAQCAARKGERCDMKEVTSCLRMALRAMNRTLER